MSTKLKEILTKNGPYPTTLNPNISQAKADPGLAPAMFVVSSLWTKPAKLCIRPTKLEPINKSLHLVSKCENCLSTKSIKEIYQKKSPKYTPAVNWYALVPLQDQWPPLIILYHNWMNCRVICKIYYFVHNFAHFLL